MTFPLPGHNPPFAEKTQRLAPGGTDKSQEGRPQTRKSHPLISDRMGSFAGLVSNPLYYFAVLIFSFLPSEDMTTWLSRLEAVM